MKKTTSGSNTLVHQSSVRILILSHNPLSKNQSNGKTIYSMLKDIPKSNIAQIYLSTDIPDFDLCENYYELNDFDILKRIINKKVQGKRIMSNDIDSKIIKKGKVINSKVLRIIRSVKGPFFNVMRDSLWLLAGYRTKGIRSFIENFRPNIFFFQTSGNVFSFRIARWIAERYNLKVILETTDDYLGFHISASPFYYYLHCKLNEEYSKISKKAAMIIVISDEMLNEYRGKYPGNYYVAMNSVQIKDIADKSRKDRIRLLYAGNLELGRWKTLLLLSSVIQTMNIGIEFDIYSLSKLSNNVIKKFKVYDKTRFRGAISSFELNNIRPNYDVLVHVESFNRENKIITRLSVSTKISEYLASNRAILAIGPYNVASIRYLKRINAAEIVISPKRVEVMRALERLLSDDYRYLLARNGLNAAQSNHDIDKIANDIENVAKNALIC